MSDSFVTSWTEVCQAPLSMGFPRQEYWSRLPFSSPDLSNSGIEPTSPALAGRFFITEALGKPCSYALQCRNLETLTTIYNICSSISPHEASQPSCMHAKSHQLCPTLCDPMDGARLLCPWDAPGKNTGVRCHSLLQGIFLIQVWNPSLLCLLH